VPCLPDEVASFGADDLFGSRRGVLGSGGGLVPGVVQRATTLSAAVGKSLYSLVVAHVIKESSQSGGAGFLNFVIQCGAKV